MPPLQLIILTRNPATRDYRVMSLNVWPSDALWPVALQAWTDGTTLKER
jgi:hypothetical protein